MNTAEALIRLLEQDGVKHIFGHPGEQILPFYKALKDSSIEHMNRGLFMLQTLMLVHQAIMECAFPLQGQVQ